MPPTIIVTVGRLPLELEAPPPLVAAGPLLLPDEHAATVRAVAHAAASAAMEPLLRPIFRMVLLLIVEVRERTSERERTGNAQTAVASVAVCGRQASSRRSSRL